jgi:hypothetical protein
MFGGLTRVFHWQREWCNHRTPSASICYGDSKSTGSKGFFDLFFDIAGRSNAPAAANSSDEISGPEHIFSINWA